MRQLAALLAVITLALGGCEQRTPTDPRGASRPSAPSSAAGAASATATFEVRIDGSAEYDGPMLSVPISVMNGVAGEECEGLGEAVARDGSNIGATRARWANDGNTTHFDLLMHSQIDRSWTQELVHVTITAVCASGTDSDERTVQAHR